MSVALSDSRLSLAKIISLCCDVPHRHWLLESISVLDIFLTVWAKYPSHARMTHHVDCTTIYA